jgi:nicotinate-nucleotide--dimethylbenzimidazole phosphoribosyltransferase
MKALERQASLTKPPGSLGRLETLAVQLSEAQGTVRPSARPASAILFAADHPVVNLGVSAYPQAVTRAMVLNFVAGGAAASVAARRLGIDLHVVDVGVAGAEPVAGAFRADVANRLEGDLVTSDAMSPEVFAEALEAGAAAVGRLAPDVRVVILGEMGIGNSTLASAVAAATTGAAVDDVVGRGTGVDEEGLVRKRSVVSQALARVGPVSPREALRRLGGRELASIFGAAMAAIERGKVVLVDGAIVTSALLALVSERPEARAQLVFAHRSADRSHATMLRWLDVAPLLDLGLRLGEASGALVAFPLLELACALQSEMATFGEAAVPEGR